MLRLLYLTQIIISVLLTISILLQNRGTGLSATFGGDFSRFHTRRGIEKFLTITAGILGALFIINSFLIFLFTA